MKAVKTIGITLLVTGLLFILFIGFFHRTINMPVHGGGSLRIIPASCLAMWLGSTCDIRYRSRVGTSGTVSVAHTWGSAPIIVIPSEDGKVLLCLYGIEDMGLWLLKFDTTKVCEDIPSGSHVGEIVRKSPWKVDLGTIDDWRWMYYHLKSMPENEFKSTSIPEFDFGIKRVDLNREGMLPNVRGYAWPYGQVKGNQ